VTLQPRTDHSLRSDACFLTPSDCIAQRLHALWLKFSRFFFPQNFRVKLPPDRVLLRLGKSYKLEREGIHRACSSAENIGSASSSVGLKS
jgi:hypothetical protein